MDLLRLPFHFLSFIWWYMNSLSKLKIKDFLDRRFSSGDVLRSKLVLPTRLGLENTPTAFLQRGKPHPLNECPGIDTKQSDSEVLVMLELWGMWSTLLWPLLLGQLWPGVVVPDRILFKGQIELNCGLTLIWLVGWLDLWHINLYRLLNARAFLHIYIWFVNANV